MNELCDHENSFNSILTKNNLKTIHQKNLEYFAIEIFKFQSGLSPPIMNDIFFSRQNILYNLQKFQELFTSIKNTVDFGTKIISFRGPQMWNLTPDNIKLEPTLEFFKKKIRKWKCESCPSAKYRLYQLIKILLSILPIVPTNLFYHTLKHCFRWLEVDFD